MTKLPPGWASLPLAGVARLGSGGTPTAGNADYYGGEIPWAVIGDLNDGLTTNTKSRITRRGLENSSAKMVPVDAILIAMYGSIGKLGVAGVEMATNQAIAFAIPNERVLPKYLFCYLLSQRSDLDRAGKGATQRNISQTILRSWPVRFPADLGEQRRIVAILDDHLSRLDAASSYLEAARLRAHTQMKALLLEAVPERGRYPAGWRAVRIGEAGEVKLGRQRHPDWHNGSNMRPYLRVANVFEDRIDTSDVMEMHWSEPAFEQFKLLPGDVLLNEGQSPELLGRPALYRGDPPEVAFTNTLLRFRAHPDVLPEWALLVFRRHMHAGRFRKESRITTNIGHLSSSRLKEIEFPIPPRVEQEQLVAKVRADLDDVERVRIAIRASDGRAQALRRAILGAALSGQLTSQPRHESTDWDGRTETQDERT